MIFQFNAALLRSFNATFDYFFEWLKASEEDKPNRKAIQEEGVSANYFVDGLLHKKDLIDYIENFVLFYNQKTKIIAKNHQFIGVNNLFRSVLNREKLEGKDLCHISMGNKLDYINMTKDSPAVNFVGRSAGNNGVADRVDLIPGIAPYRAGCITVALGGSLGSAYLQTEDFYTSQNVAVLTFEKEITNSAKLFITTSIMNESKYKYFPFGRELNTHIRTDFGFALPVKCNTSGTPIIDTTHKYLLMCDKEVIEV